MLTVPPCEGYDHTCDVVQSPPHKVCFHTVCVAEAICELTRTLTLFFQEARMTLLSVCIGQCVLSNIATPNDLFFIRAFICLSIYVPTFIVDLYCLGVPISEVSRLVVSQLVRCPDQWNVLISEVS